MIEKRAKAFVTSKGLVPVDKIASEIGKGKTVDGLKRLFPMLSTDDIFEAVEFYAENTSLPLMEEEKMLTLANVGKDCLLYTSPSPRDGLLSRMPSSA